MLLGDPASAIKYGQQVFSINVGWHVTITNKNNEVCSGSIITSRTVLTLASCIYKTSVQYTVTALSNKRDLRYGYQYTVLHVHPHPQWQESQRFSTYVEFNIGIAELEKPFAMASTLITAIPLNLMYELPDPNGEVPYTSGFNSDGPNNARKLMMSLTQPVQPDHECERYYGNILPDYLICAGHMDLRAPCYEDYGAGLVLELFYEPVLLGILVNGPSDCHLSGTPMIYMRVSWHIEWLTRVHTEIDKRATEELGFCACQLEEQQCFVPN